MTTRFFTVDDDTLGHRGLPWVKRIVRGYDRVPVCVECKGDLGEPRGDLLGQLELNGARTWPDALGCGAYPLLVVSERVLEAWSSTGTYPTHRIDFVDPIPKRLRDLPRPNYYWFDGGAMLGARLDFDASGHVGGETETETGPINI